MRRFSRKSVSPLHAGVRRAGIEDPARAATERSAPSHPRCSSLSACGGRWLARALAGLAALGPILFGSSAHAGSADYIHNRNAVPVNGRQVFEVRLGTSVRTSDGLEIPLVVVVTGGPTPGTTTLAGAQLDGASLFDGGPNPSFTNIVASGGIFSLGGGCERGTVTEFPFILTNRPRIARFNSSTGLFSVVTPTIAGTDSYDSIDCAPSPVGTLFATTNSTLGRVEIYRDNGAGFVPVQVGGITGVATPFSGGMRPGLGFQGIQNDMTLSFMRSNGANEFVSVNASTGTLGTPCIFFNAPAPSGFVRPRESLFRILPNGGARLAVGDFDDNGTTDIVTIPPGSCTPTATSAGAGSSNGGNGYNWTGYATATGVSPSAENILWGDYFYVDPHNNFVHDSPINSPFAGRGGPFHGCGVGDRDSGPSMLAVSAGTSNLTLQFSLLEKGALNDPEFVQRTGFEQRAVIDTQAFATCP